MTNYRYIERYGTLLLDLLCLAGSFAAAISLRFGSLSRAEDPEIYRSFLAYIIMFIILYNLVRRTPKGLMNRGYYAELLYCLHEMGALSVFIGLAVFILRLGSNFSRLVFGYTVLTGFGSLFIAHCVFKKLLRIFFKNESSRKRVFVINDPQNKQNTLDNTPQNCPDGNLSIKDPGSFEVFQNPLNITLPEDSRLCASFTWGDDGGYQELIELLRLQAVDEVYINAVNIPAQDLKNIIMDITTMGMVCRYKISLPGVDLRGATAGDYAGTRVLSFGELSTKEDSRLVLKRMIDIAGALTGLVITGIMYPFIALAIKLDSPGPVVFRQVRIGRNGRRFKIYKFRSMYVDAEARKKELESQNQMKGLMFKMEDDPRITKVGHFIRKTSLDEFPQFLNVLKGDMSLVGTRPPTEDEFKQYTPYYRRRLCMKPGLTGLWQVSGRSSITDFDQVVKLDLKYIDTWSLSLDIKILFQTVAVVIFGKGAS